MKKLFFSLVPELQNIWRSLRKRIPEKLRRILRLAIQAIVVIACIIFLVSQVKKIPDPKLILSWQWQYIVIAIISVVISLLMGVMGWWLIMGLFGINFDLQTAAFIHLRANLAKYIPGYAWQLVGKAYLTRREGVGPKVISAAMMLEFLLLVSSGTVLGAAIVMNHVLQLPTEWRYLVVTAGGLCALLITGLPFFWSKIKTIFKISTRFSMAKYISAIIAIIVGWLALALSIWALTAAIIPTKPESWPIFIFVTVGSFVLSLIVIFIPAGIGVRESIITFLLAQLTGTGIAALVATFSRLLLIICEITAAGVITLVHRRQTPNYFVSYKENNSQK
jgi:glycosyltransferase 2 family protein